MKIFTPPVHNIDKENPVEWILNHVAGTSINGYAIVSPTGPNEEPEYVITDPQGRTSHATIHDLTEAVADWAHAVGTPFARTLLAEAEGQFFREHDQHLTPDNVAALLKAITG